MIERFPLESPSPSYWSGILGHSKDSGEACDVLRKHWSQIESSDIRQFAMRVLEVWMPYGLAYDSEYLYLLPTMERGCELLVPAPVNDGKVANGIDIFTFFSWFGGTRVTPPGDAGFFFRFPTMARKNIGIKPPWADAIELFVTEVGDLLLFRRNGEVGYYHHETTDTADFAATFLAALFKWIDMYGKGAPIGSDF